MKVAGTLGILGAFLLVVACGPTANHNQAVYVLIDTSGTYVKEMNKAQGVVNYLLGTINTGNPFDSMIPTSDGPRRYGERVIDMFHKMGLDALVVIGA